MHPPNSPENLAKQGISPGLFELAQDYALVASEQKITHPVDMKAVDTFNDVLKGLVGKCIELSNSDPCVSKVPRELRWVEVAKKALRECGRNNPKLGGYHKSRIFGPNCVELQRQLYEDAVSGQIDKDT